MPDDRPCPACGRKISDHSLEGLFKCNGLT